MRFQQPEIEGIYAHIIADIMLTVYGISLGGYAL